MEFVGRVLDGSFGWDLRDLIRKGEESGRLPQDEKVRHLQKVDIFADCTRKQLKAVAASRPRGGGAGRHHAHARRVSRARSSSSSSTARRSSM